MPLGADLRAPALGWHHHRRLPRRLRPCAGRRLRRGAVLRHRSRGSRAGILPSRVPREHGLRRRLHLRHCDGAVPMRLRRSMPALHGTRQRGVPVRRGVRCDVLVEPRLPLRHRLSRRTLRGRMYARRRLLWQWDMRRRSLHGGPCVGARRAMRVERRLPRGALLRPRGTRPVRPARRVRQLCTGELSSGNRLPRDLPERRELVCELLSRVHARGRCVLRRWILVSPPPDGPVAGHLPAAV